MEDEMIERAKELAELTGRDLEDVLADLADDGILNQSNKEDKDLISQLKEAAELINTVQEINKEVSETTKPKSPLILLSKATLLIVQSQAHTVR